MGPDEGRTNHISWELTIETTRIFSRSDFLSGVIHCFHPFPKPDHDWCVLKLVTSLGKRPFDLRLSPEQVTESLEFGMYQLLLPEELT